MLTGLLQDPVPTHTQLAASTRSGPVRVDVATQTDDSLLAALLAQRLSLAHPRKPCTALGSRSLSGASTGRSVRK